MLELIELSLDTIKQSNKCMEKAIHDLEALKVGSMQLTFSFREMLRSLAIKLTQQKDTLD